MAASARILKENDFNGSTYFIFDGAIDCCVRGFATSRWLRYAELCMTHSIGRSTDAERGVKGGAFGFHADRATSVEGEFHFGFCADWRISD